MVGRAACDEQLPYREGDWFAVPLRDGVSFAVGRVARMARGGVLLGYFFGPRRSDVPSLAQLRAYDAREAVVIRRFGDLSLIEGKWPVLGQDGPWVRTSWPIPTFGRLVDVLSPPVAWLVEYPADDPNATPRETRTSPEACKSLPSDGLLGAGAVELLLTKVLQDN
jgi:hypothetical protein